MGELKLTLGADWKKVLSGWKNTQKDMADPFSKMLGGVGKKWIKELQGMAKGATPGSAVQKYNDFFQGLGRGFTGKNLTKKMAGSGAANLGLLLGRAGALFGILGIIASTGKKILDTLSESSAALKATLTIYGQAFRIFFKPFGDFLSTLLRPLGIWLLKAAVKFNQLFGGNPATAETKTEAGLQAGTKAVVGAGTGAVAGGLIGAGVGAIFGGVGAVPGAAIGAAIGALVGELIAVWPIFVEAGKIVFAKVAEWGTAAWEGIKTFFTETLPAAAQAAWDGIVNFFTTTLPAAANGAWNSIKNWFANIGDTISAGWDSAKTFVTETIPTALVEAWEAVKTFFVATLPDAIKVAWETVKTFFTTTVPGWITGAWDSVKKFFTETVPGWVKSMIDKAKSYLPSFLGGGGSGGSGSSGGTPKALGGIVDSRQTVTVGERGPEAIIPLKNLQSMGGGNVTQHIVIQGGVDMNNIDSIRWKIEQAARATLRRRTSYGG